MKNQVVKFIAENWKNVIRENTTDEGSLIGLPYPYAVSCAEGMFRELYYWGTYFTNIGLILSGNTQLAQNNIDNMTYLISKCGFMPNGNRTFFLDRSQPPFLSQMIVELYAVTKDFEWLKDKYKSLKTEYEFWKERRMTPSGLNRFYGEISDREAAVQFGRYMCKRFAMDVPRDEVVLEEYGKAMYSFAESGWDCTSRYGLEPHHYNSLELNCMLYNLEKNLSFIATEIRSNESPVWEEKASVRKSKMQELMWNDKQGFFADYNFVTKKQNDIVATSTFYPLFVGLADEMQAVRIHAALEKIEEEYGLASTEKRDDLYDLQWDHPYGWPCQQYIVIQGLLNYGYREDAVRLAQKYMDTVEHNFDKNGNLWEKYNVCTGGVTDNKEYDTPPIMGWAAATYLYCINLLENEEGKYAN